LDRTRLSAPAPLPSLRLLLSAYPCRLPHVSIEGGETYLGRLKDPEVGDAEREFLAAADGRTRFAEILARGPHLLAAGASRYAVWLSRPLGTPPPPAAGERCLLLGAHPGDVELSMGGWALRRRGEARLTLLNCFTRQLATRLPESFGRRAEVTAVRRDESWLAAGILGVESRSLDLPEHALRHAEDGLQRLTLPPEELESALATALCDTLAELVPDHLYAPAALGDDPDQRLLFDLLLELYDEGRFPGTRFHFYENFPPAASHLNVDDFLARFEGSYLDLDPWFEETAGVLPEKLALLEVFRSRLGLDRRPLLLAVGRRNARLARLAAAGAERFWTLRDAALLG
jgi:LmbE family N-acetylglucosaminyl deacetylase